MVERLSLSIQHVENLPLLFPAWCVHQVSQNQKFDTKPFLKDHLPFMGSVNYCQWDENLVELAEKLDPSKRKKLALHLLNDVIKAYAEKDAGSVAFFVESTSKDYPCLLDFIELYVDEKKIIFEKTKPLRQELDYLENLSPKWKKIALEGIISTSEGREMLGKYITREAPSFSMNEKYWLVIIKEIVPDWLGIRAAWKWAPKWAFEQTKKALEEMENQYWFIEAPDSELAKVCELVLEEKRQVYPEWCKQWIVRKIHNSSLRHLSNKLYQEILLDK